jgi:hypothetical protein
VSGLEDMVRARAEVFNVSLPDDLLARRCGHQFWHVPHEVDSSTRPTVWCDGQPPQIGLPPQ